jgi:Tfp pilus assembly protein PilN
MASLGRRVVLEVSPSRQTLAIFRGATVVRACSERVEMAEGRKTWSDTLLALQPKLARWALELGINGSRVTVVYTGPETTAAVFSCPISAGRARAFQAATLALGEATAYPIEQNPHEVIPVARDADGGPPGADGKPRPAQLHCLAAADTEISASALAGSIRSADLVPGEFLPAPGAMLAAAIRRLALEESKAEPACRLVLWLGEHGSVLAAGTKRRTAFVRHLPLGVETLVDAMSRPPAGGFGPSNAMSRAEARELLFTTGIPAPGAGGNGAAGGPSVLPLIQPVLQKYTVETKQSIRFGLSAEDRSRLRFIVTGPGAAIAGLADIIARDCGIESFETEGTAGLNGDGAEPLRGDVSAFLSAGSLPLNLLPQEVLRAVALRRTRVAMWAGMAVTAATVAFDGVSSSLLLDKEQQTLATLTEKASQPNESRAALEKAQAARQGVVQASKKIEASVGRLAAWGDAMTALAAVTPETIRLRELRAEIDATGPSCRITGAVRSGEGVPAASIVKRYVDDLSRVPLFRSAKLGATQRRSEKVGEAGAPEEILAFEITVGLLPLPREAMVAALAQAQTTNEQPVAGVEEKP